MKRFVKTIIISIAFLFLINGVLDVYVSNSLQHSKSPLYKTWNEITNSKINADLLILGSSRASWQYNPHVLDSILHANSYVLGFDGSSFGRQIVKYNIYSHFQTKKPKYIIVNVDYMDNFLVSKGIEREQLFPYMTNSYIRQQFLSVDSFSFAEKYIPVFRYTTQKGVFALLNRDGKYVDKNIVKGYLPQNYQWNPALFNAVSIWHFKVDDEIVLMFDKFLSERKTENIKIIFCYAPIYIGLTKKVDNLDEMYNTYESIAEKYNIPILDYTYSSISQDTMCFIDATHLSGYGSELFTVKLSHDLDSLGVFFE